MNLLDFEVRVRPETGLSIAKFGKSQGLAVLHGYHSYRFKHFRIALHGCASILHFEDAAGLREAADIIELLRESDDCSEFSNYLQSIEDKLRKKLGPRSVQAVPKASRTRRRNLSFLFDDSAE